MTFLLLTGAGCSTGSPSTDTSTPLDPTDPNFVPNHFIYTEHGSRINAEGIDEALFGTWELDSLMLVGGAIESPFFGHTMVYSNTGGLSQNFSSEQYVGGAEGFADCEISGSTLSTAFTELSYIDSEDDDGNLIDTLTLTYLNIYDKTGHAEVECQGPTGVNISTLHQSAELGTGPATSDSRGMHVSYYYEMDDTWSILNLYLGEPDDGAYLAKYSYSRLSGPYPWDDGYDGS